MGMFIVIVVNLISLEAYSNTCDSCFKFVNNKQYKEALTCYMVAIKKNNEFNSCLYYGRAYSYYGLNNFDDAKKDIFEIIKRINDNDSKIGLANTYFLLSRVYSKENNREQEIENLYKSIEFTPKTDVLVTLSYALGKAERFEESIEVATKAISLNPKSAFAYSNRGYSYLMQNELKKAESDFDTSYNLNPNNPYLYKFKGILNIKRNDKKNACENFYKSINLKGQNFENISDSLEIYQFIDKNCK